MFRYFHYSLLQCNQSYLEKLDRFEDAIKEGKIHLKEDEHSVGGGTIQYRLYLWDKTWSLRAGRYLVLFAVAVLSVNWIVATEVRVKLDRYWIKDANKYV